jgi:hypothetical protein
LSPDLLRGWTGEEWHGLPAHVPIGKMPMPRLMRELFNGARWVLDARRVFAILMLSSSIEKLALKRRWAARNVYSKVLLPTA